MEIGGEGIDHLKFITWLDENIGPACIGFQLAIEFIADGFKSADRGCTDSHDPAFRQTLALADFAAQMLGYVAAEEGRS